MQKRSRDRDVRRSLGHLGASRPLPPTTRPCPSGLAGDALTRPFPFQERKLSTLAPGKASRVV